MDVTVRLKLFQFEFRTKNKCSFIEQKKYMKVFFPVINSPNLKLNKSRVSTLYTSKSFECVRCESNAKDKCTLWAPQIKEAYN